MHAVRVRSRHRGFTLIELLVVVTLLGVLLAAALPSFDEAQIRSRLVSQHNELVAGLSLARSEAIRRNASVAVCAANTAQTDCQASWGNNWLVWHDEDADGALDAGEDVLQVGGGGAGIDLSSPSGAGHVVFRFNARGARVQPTDIDGRLRVRPTTCPSGKAYQWTLSVLTTGALRTTKENC